MMPNVGPLEILLVLIVALVVFGPKKLPDLGHSLGKGIREFKGSVTPRVSSRSWPAGSAALATSSSSWFCQKQSASATPKMAMQTTSRARSSSRCSTRLI